LVLATLILRFQVEELVFSMGVPLNGAPQAQAGVLSMAEFLVLLSAVAFQLNFVPVVFGGLILSSKARTIQL
jgi:hypothetical protein